MSACETVGNRYWDGSTYSLGGETKADFTEPSFQQGSWRGTHLGTRERGWDGAESGVQLCAAEIRRAVGCFSSRHVPLTIAPSLLCSLPAGILQVSSRGPAVCEVPLAQPLGEPGSPRVPLRQQLLPGRAGPPLGRLHP